VPVAAARPAQQRGEKAALLREQRQKYAKKENQQRLRRERKPVVTQIAVAQPHTAAINCKRKPGQ